MAPQSSAKVEGSSLAKKSFLMGDPGSSSNDYFKQNEDWWKDPFAMFEDEEDESMSNESPVASSNDINDDFEEDLPLISEPDFPEILPPPVPIQNSMPQPEFQKEIYEGPPSPRPMVQELSAVRTRKPIQQVNPLIEQTLSSPVDHIVIQETAPLQPTSTAVVAKFGYLLRTLPLVQVLLSFAFVKVIQPVMDRMGPESENKLAATTPDRRVPEEQRKEDYESRRPMEEQGRYYDRKRSVEGEDRYAQYAPQHARHLTRGGGSASVGWFQRMFGTPIEATEKLPPAKDLMEQLEYLQLELAAIKSEKESMEREYEKASWQLQETQNEMANLQSTTNYLKAQLRDNQEVMDRAVRAERRKARDELSKMKEAMLQVLQRERQELRAKMMKQTAEVQAILKDREAVAQTEGK